MLSVASKSFGLTYSILPRAFLRKLSRRLRGILFARLVCYRLFINLKIDQRAVASPPYKPENGDLAHAAYVTVLLPLLRLPPLARILNPFDNKSTA